MALSHIHQQDDLVRPLIILQMLHQVTHRSSHFSMAIPGRILSPQIEVLREGPDILESLCRNLVLVANEDLREFNLDVGIVCHERKEGHVRLGVSSRAFFLPVGLTWWQGPLSENEPTLSPKVKGH